MKKYELTSESIEVGRHKLFRIKALKNLSAVKEGDLGGFIEKEDNLSQDGDCWVFNNARAYSNACVRGDAKVFGNACVYGNAQVFDNACVYDNARVRGNARVFCEACVSGNVRVSGNAHVYDNACVFGNAKVRGNARMYAYFKLSSGSFGGSKDKNDLFMRCPQEGSFIAFKKVFRKKDHHFIQLVLKLEVSADAKRSSADGNKCRCSKAKAIKFYNLDGMESEETEARSSYNDEFVYRVGETVEVKDFDDNRWKECSSGIHFFMSFEEARDY